MAESGPGRVSVRFLSGFLLFLFYSIALADGATGENLRLRMEAQIDLLVINLLRGPVGQQVERFYTERAYKPAWSMGGRPTHQVDELRQVVAATFAHGLDPSDYHQEALDGFNNQLEAISATDLELLATSAYLGLASHLLSGRVDPVQLDKDWQVERKAIDLVAHLEQALADGRIGASLTELLPQQAGYRRLVEQLAGLRMQPDWPVVPAGSRLEVGSADERVVALRARLAAAGLLEDNELTDATFDSAVAAAVKSFQQRHGLEDDGVVGNVTLQELNTGRHQRIQQIMVNLERWRWQPNDLGRRHLRVNIAAYHLEAWQDGSRRLDMKVIVGKDYRRTPVFSEQLRYLVLNPRWVVPRRIAVEDKLPLFRKDPASISARGFDIYQGWADNQLPIDPATIDWGNLSARSFPYRLVQRSGPQNALGRIKFMLPNRFDVYLHDTPDRHLFERNDRNFSSGCIRVHRPLELAEWVLDETPGWSRSEIDRALATKKEKTVNLQATIPVHIQYTTAWVDDAGQLQLRRDAYGRDKAVAAALASK